MFETVRAAAADVEVILRRGLQDYLLHGGKLCCRLINITTDAGCHLQHTFGDIVLHFSGGELRLHGVNQTEESPAQVIAPAD